MKNELNVPCILKRNNMLISSIMDVNISVFNDVMLLDVLVNLCQGNLFQFLSLFSFWETFSEPEPVVADHGVNYLSNQWSRGS